FGNGTDAPDLRLFRDFEAGLRTDLGFTAGGAIKTQDAVTGSSGLYTSHTKLINEHLFIYNHDEHATFYLNYMGYNDAYTQTRDFYIGDGKGAKIALFKASDKSLEVVGGVTAVKVSNGGNPLQMGMVDIGPWNMNSSGYGTDYIYVLPILTTGTIVSWQVNVYGDSQQVTYNLTHIDGYGVGAGTSYLMNFGSVWYIRCRAWITKAFDNSGFSSILINRGRNYHILVQIRRKHGNNYSRN
ncbi:MAG: hypothetical protein NTV01_00405, partial [Bacteroidia bacterium]|nr:hypothetical protein [Bacteroidia bacterium]